MIVMAIVTIVFSAVAGFIAYRSGGLVVHWFKQLASYVVIIGLTIGAGQAGYAVAQVAAKQDAIGGYHQFLNGTVVAADTQTITCTEDGACAYHYDCDPYLQAHYYTTTDSKGNSTTHVYYTTEYHACPYATREYAYTTTDSIGDVQKFSRAIDANPAPWRGSTAIPTTIPRGAPVPWQKAANALKSGVGIPVTVGGTYDNYILASSDELLKSSSTKIALLRKKHLLPEHTHNLQNPIYDTYDARKLSFVGFTPKNEAGWQDALMQLNAALGSTLRGDLHVVAVKASLLPSNVSPQQYLTALKADWLNNHGKYALAKNGIMVVIGVNDAGTDIVWSRASTGMPAGNGAMLQRLGTQLTDTPFTVSSVFGSTVAHVADGKVNYSVGSGLVAQTIMVEFPFKRVCMACTDEDEKSQIGYVNIPIPAHVGVGGYILTSFCVLLLAAGLWWLYGFLFVMPALEWIEEQKRLAELAARRKREQERRDPFGFLRRF